jgi:hypothetical protein
MAEIKNEIVWYIKVLVVSFVFFFIGFNIVDGPVWAIGNAGDDTLSQLLTTRLVMVFSIGLMAIVFFFVYVKLKKTNRGSVATSYWETAEAILSDPLTRPELKKAVKTLDRMRPLDALQDAVILCNLQQIRAKELRKSKKTRKR